MIYCDLNIWIIYRNPRYMTYLSLNICFSMKWHILTSIHVSAWNDISWPQYMFQHETIYLNLNKCFSTPRQRSSAALASALYSSGPATGSFNSSGRSSNCDDGEMQVHVVISSYHEIIISSYCDIVISLYRHIVMITIMQDMQSDISIEDDVIDLNNKVREAIN